MFGNTLVVVLAIFGLFATVGLLLAVWSQRYMKVGAHQALVVAGRGGMRVITGGAMFVAPVLYRVFTVDLQAHIVTVQRTDIYTRYRVPINVEGVLVYKVRGDEEAIKAAAQALQQKSVSEIQDMIQSVADGAFRDICGKMTPEEINEDREGFQRRVAETASGHFERLGIELVTFTVRHISDDGGYFENLGVPKAAEIAKEARQRKAEADRAAIVTEAEQRRDSERRKAETEAEVFAAQKDRDVKKAQYDAEVAAEQASARQAGPRADATALQEVVSERTKLAERESERVQKELLATRIRPAEAEKEAQIIRADGEKQALIMRGQGEGESAKLRGEGEAAAIKAKLVAEAEGLERKATAMTSFNEATMRLEIAKEALSVLPKIVEAAAAPVSRIDSIRIVDFGAAGGADGHGGPIGRLLDIPPQSIARADEVLRATMGISLAEMIQLVRSGKAADVVEGTKTKE